MRLDLAPLVDELAAALAERLIPEITRRVVTEPLADARRPMPGSDLDLWRAYTAAEAGVVLGLSAKAVRHIPEGLLPRTRVGQTGSHLRYMGIHLVCYMAGIEPPDLKAIAEDVRRRFIAEATILPAPSPPGSGRRRVL